jgi:hypothetical protein
VAIMVAPKADRCKPLVTVPRAAIISVMPFWLSPGPGDCIRLRLGRDVRCWGAVAGNVQCRETSRSGFRATSGPNISVNRVIDQR